jgi:hypothetical protein
MIVPKLTPLPSKHSLQKRSMFLPSPRQQRQQQPPAPTSFAQDSRIVPEREQAESLKTFY